jgi:hypothetical protein
MLVARKRALSMNYHYQTDGIGSGQAFVEREPPTLGARHVPQMHRTCVPLRVSSFTWKVAVKILVQLGYT